MCDIFIMCFVLSEILSLEAVAAATASAVVVVVEEGRRRRSLWVYYNLHKNQVSYFIVHFTLSSSSDSQSLSFNLLQSLYCPLFLVLTICLQIKVCFFFLSYFYS